MHKYLISRCAYFIFIEMDKSARARARVCVCVCVCVICCNYRWAWGTLVNEKCLYERNINALYQKRNAILDVQNNPLAHVKDISTAWE